MKKTYEMEDVDCANCAAKMERAIAALDGVRSAGINFFAQKLTVEFEDGADERAVLKAALKACRRVDAGCNIIF